MKKSQTTPIISVLGTIVFSIGTAGLARADTTGPAGGNQPHNNVQPYTVLNPIVALQGVFPSRNVEGNGASFSEPFLGEISYFAGNFAPRGWALAQGQLLPIASNTALFSLYGTQYGGDGRTTFALPDLRGRTMVGFGAGPGLTSRPIGSKFGTETHTLTTAEMPAHQHGLPMTIGETTTSTGGGQPHSNIQPSLASNYIIALQGTFPSRNLEGNTASAADPFIGQITGFGGNFAPRGWAMANGQLLQISDNPALFSILGTQYGGDGRTTFGLPDLRGRTMVGAGNGPGLIPLRNGDKFGTETHALTTAQMPSHSHPPDPGIFPDLPTDPAGGGGPHPNVQPSLASRWIIATTGLFPSRNLEGNTASASEPFIGQITGFAGNFAPRGWEFAEGQLLDIAPNTALFSILGTTYGGDGRTTFGLPDLRGRIILGSGNGPGLTSRPLGQRGGTEFETLSVANLPIHTHDFTVPEPITLLGASTAVAFGAAFKRKFKRA